MIFHIIIILFMITAAAAFLILWYLWVKRKLESAYFLDDEQQTLFPFRHFSWLLIGVILVTCLTQIHFVRVSSTVHQKLSELVAPPPVAERVSAADLAELKSMVTGLREEVVELGLKTEQARMAPKTKITPPEKKPAAASERPAAISRPRAPRKDALIALKPKPRPSVRGNFAGEAKASSAKSAVESPPAKKADPSEARPPAKAKEEKEVWSMTLNLAGTVTADSLNVRKRPSEKSQVIDRLASGQVVKVTEKRVVGDRVWFRVVTADGRAGWVDFRYLRLQARRTT